MRAKTFEQFVESRVSCDDIGYAIGDVGLEKSVGYVYLDHLYIESLSDGTFLLTLGNEQYEDTDLTKLERMLYEWAIGEGYFGGGEAKHTPGPWFVDWLDDMNGWVLDASGNYLAEIVTEDDEERCVSAEEQQANARLMAAAPELLAALRGLVDLLDERNEGLKTRDEIEFNVQCAREAIAKAEGK